MRKLSILALTATMLFAGNAEAQDTYVNGYVRKDGAYVQPHFRSAPDSNPYNNYSTQGNTNPYTGERGYKNPYSNSNSYQNPYGSNNSNRGYGY